MTHTRDMGLQMAGLYGSGAEAEESSTEPDFTTQKLLQVRPRVTISESAGKTLTSNMSTTTSNMCTWRAVEVTQNGTKWEAKRGRKLKMK